MTNTWVEFGAGFRKMDRAVALALMRTHVETLFTLDPVDRLLTVNEPGGAPAPRFFMGQTLAGNQWWFRDDLGVELVRALEAQCLLEPLTSDVRKSNCC